MTQTNEFSGRRNFLKLAGVGGIGLGMTAAGITTNAEPSLADVPTTGLTHEPVPSNVALQRLIDGNERFVNQQGCLLSDQIRFRQQETASEQYPFAAILGCADSRVPAEIIFNQGIGDLFIVRVAGNVAADEAIGSLEYATALLGAQLIVVLGHTNCGAVKAAVENKDLPGRISSFVENIKPGIERLRNVPGGLEDISVTAANVRYQVQQLRESPTILGSLRQAGKLLIVGGYYELASGKFTLLS